MNWALLHFFSRLLKKVIQQGRSRVTTGGVTGLTCPSRAAEQLFPGGYVEDCNDPRTKLGGFLEASRQVAQTDFQQGRSRRSGRSNPT